MISQMGHIISVCKNVRQKKLQPAYLGPPWGLETSWGLTAALDHSSMALTMSMTSLAAPESMGAQNSSQMYTCTCFLQC